MVTFYLFVLIIIYLPELWSFLYVIEYFIWLMVYVLSSISLIIQLINFRNWFILVVLIWIWLLFYSTLNLLTLTFELDAQWILLTWMYILGSLRGFILYIILNGILTVCLVISLTFGNHSLYIFGIFGKFGFFPLFMYYYILFSLSSYLFLLVDCINKLSYFLILSLFEFRLCLEYLQYVYVFFSIFMNILLLIVYIKNMISSKHLIIISSFLQLNLVIALSILSTLVYIFTILSLYTIGSLGLIVLCLVSLTLISISYFNFLYDSIFPSNIVGLLKFLYVLLLFASLPIYSFFFKFFSLILLSSIQYLYSFSFGFILLLLSSYLFLSTFSRFMLVRIVVAISVNYSYFSR